MVVLVPRRVIWVPFHKSVLGLIHHQSMINWAMVELFTITISRPKISKKTASWTKWTSWYALRHCAEIFVILSVFDLIANLYIITLQMVTATVQHDASSEWSVRAHVRVHSCGSLRSLGILSFLGDQSICVLLHSSGRMARLRLSASTNESGKSKGKFLYFS